MTAKPRTAWQVGGPWIALIAGAAVTARLPFAGQPLSSDEGGFLLVASQWTPGRSLYGDYWVDRPPLLVDAFALADRLGGMVPLRVLGAVLVLCAVLLAGRIGAVVSGEGDSSRSRRRAAVLAATTAAIFLANPLFGALEVGGELIAVPLVLLGVLLVLGASRCQETRARLAIHAAAGAAGAAAALVKQNELDVFVLVAVLTVTALRGRVGSAAWVDLGGVLVGAAALSTAVLAHASSLGTGPADLWAAIVTFRLDASTVIQSSASSATTGRLQLLLLALVVSGAPLLVALFVARLRRPPTPDALDLRWPVLALLGWEMLSVMGGGSYWLHYLICLVPGLVLAVAHVVSAPPRSRGWVTRSTSALLVYAALAAGVSIGYSLIHADRLQHRTVVSDWLSAHAHAGDSAVIAYGQPNILRSSRLSSPYSELWSLPVRVRDPHLHELAGVLAGTDRPDWVITGAGRLASWGIDARAGQAQLAAHYREVADIDDHYIYRERRLHP